MPNTSSMKNVGAIMKSKLLSKVEGARCAVSQMLEWMGWSPAAPDVVSASLAQDLGMPQNEVSRILDRTAADLRKLSETESHDPDARPIIDRAVSELGSLGFQARPFEEAAMDRYLRELPERDFQILENFKLGKKHSEIAELLNTDVEDIRNSLVKTYADLRMAMMISGGGGGGGEPMPKQDNRYVVNE